MLTITLQVDGELEKNARAFVAKHAKDPHATPEKALKSALLIFMTIGAEAFAASNRQPGEAKKGAHS